MSSFVKLDSGILDSTLWIDLDCRNMFITALLMAEPREIREPIAQIEVATLSETGWSVPPGWYGFVPAAGVGIARQAGLDREKGLSALERLGNPELDSRSRAFDGRRMVRVDGGFIILNFIKYRERDYTAAERSRRWRNRKAEAAKKAVEEKVGDTRVAVSDTRDNTQAEAEAEIRRRSRPPDPERAREGMDPGGGRGKADLGR